MIGPTPSFYDPDHAAPQHTTDYHHWLDTAYLPAPQYDPPHIQQPLPNQYHFVPSQPAHHAPPKDGSSYSTYFEPAPAPAPAQPYRHPAPPMQYYIGADAQYALGDAAFAGDAQQQQLYTPLSETLPSVSVSPTWPDSAPASASTAAPAPKRGKAAAGAPAAKGKAGARKRPRKGGEDSDSDDDDAGEEHAFQHHQPAHPPQQVGLPQRLPGACTYCKKLKMKCDFPKNENICKRCKSGGHQCIVEGRKPRSAPNKREYLLAQIRQKDVIIESLLKQLHNPYLATPLSIAAYRMATPSSDNHRQNVIAWLDRMQSSVRGKGGPAAFTLDSRADADDGDSEHSGDEGAAPAPDPESEPEPLSAHTLVDPEMENYPGLPDAAVPLGLLANLSISNSKQRGRSVRADIARAENPDEDDDNVGVANDTYFLPGPAQDLALRAMLIDKSSPPDILVHGLVSPEDVDTLFDIFYRKVNPFIGLLEPALHTPASTFSRCPFLFTVVCATALRYSDKPEVYPIAMHFAKSAAANALIDGWKSVELCQAYILMSIYAVPARRWEEDRSWLYTGLAIRIATDLNLHQPQTRKPQNETQEREMLNRARVWMICYNLDRSTATQFGKPSTIKEDYLIRNSSDWYKKSKHNHAYDIHLNAYNSLLRIVAKFHEEVFSDPDSPTGLNKALDFREVTTRHDAYLTRYFEEWTERFARDSDPDDPAAQFRCKLLPFLTNYSRLVMYSFGFQQAFQRGLGPEDEIYITKSLGAAKEVVLTLVDSLAPSGYMRYSPDGHFIFASFASAFLLKLLRPEFVQFLPEGQEAEIFELIGRLIQVLSSPQIAIDERHTPKLYSRFLAGLLSKHRRDGATTGRLHTQPPPAHQTQHAHAPQGGAGIHRAPSATSSVMTPSSLEIQIQDPGAGHGFGLQQEPIYMAEVAYAAGTGPLELGGADEGMPFVFDSQSAMGSQEDMLATMQVIKNPAFWTNMMMPGFSWPEDPAGVADPQSYYAAAGARAQHALPNAYNFQMAQVPGMG